MAYDLNGTNQSINYTLNASQTTLNTVTYGFWAQADSYGTNYRKWWYQGTVGDREIAMEMDSGYGSPTGFVFVSKWTGTPGVWSCNAPTVNVWHHFCVTYDWGSTANDPIIYLDGVSQTIIERLGPGGTKDNNGTAFNFGSEANSSTFFDGKLTEPFMYNRILTAAEIASIGTKGFSPLMIPRGLVFYDPLIRGSAEIMGGLTASFANAPSVYEHPRIIYPSNYQLAPFAAAAAAGVIPNRLKQINQTIHRASYY